MEAAAVATAAVPSPPEAEEDAEDGGSIKRYDLSRHDEVLLLVDPTVREDEDEDEDQEEAKVIDNRVKSSSSRTAATKPSPRPQTMRNFCGGLSSPMLSMVVITRVPESDEVMNQVASRNVARAAINVFIQLMLVI